MNEKDLENINIIDMECSAIDDDDSFGSIQSSASDDRNLESKTGIILDFSDDDARPMRTITAEISPEGSLHIDRGITDYNDDFHDYNEIDMETAYADDEYDIEDSYTTENPADKVFFTDDDLDAKELVDSEMLDEAKKKKKPVTTGQVEADYWDKVTKKHNNSNKKGALYTGFRFVGNPEKEIEFFNKAMGNAESAVEGSSAAASEPADISAGGFGESLTEDLHTLTPIFDIIGFEVFPNHDNSEITVIDSCDVEPEFTCSNIKEVLTRLYPYIEDCFIYPLQIKTNQNLNSCEDWVKWYSEDNKKEYPKCADDIAYCNLISKFLK